jgi:hypothetical protein
MAFTVTLPSFSLTLECVLVAFTFVLTEVPGLSLPALSLFLDAWKVKLG